jgi:hypothetical protein
MWRRRNLLPFFKRGYEVCGYDLSPTLTDLGRSEGLNLMTGSWAVLRAIDVIILNHVLEHFLDIFGHGQTVGAPATPRIHICGCSQYRSCRHEPISECPRLLLLSANLPVSPGKVPPDRRSDGRRPRVSYVCLAAKDENPSATVAQVPAGEFRKMTRKLRFSRIKGFLNAWLVKPGWTVG